MRRFSCNFRGPLIKLAIIITVIMCLVILAIRGCVASNRCCEAEPDEISVQSDVSIRVYDDEAERVFVMPLEEYIVHAVSGEMPASFETEALKAQCIAARTYAVRRMSAYSGSPCGKDGADVCTDSGCCQSYKTDSELKKNWGDDYEEKLEKLTRAVSATSGLIMTYEGEPIEALYHSNAGGMTEDAQNVFSSNVPYLSSVESPDEDSPRAISTHTFGAREFANTVNNEYPDAKLNRKKLKSQVSIRSRYESGRVKEIALGEVRLTGREFRKLFDLDSANFSLDIDSAVTVSVYGFGHGVGMSQYGANEMALDGSSYEDILTHYYTGVSIESLSAPGH